MKKMVETQTTTYECEECGITEHNHKPIKLQLYHTDGDKKNNEVSNIRFLCPNCTSQKEWIVTWSGSSVG